MSGAEKVPELLQGQLGGSAPFFYANCQLYWNGLGDLVADSPDPLAKSAFMKDSVQMQAFEIANYSMPENDEAGHEAHNDLAVTVFMASWIHQAGSPQSPDLERQFLIRREIQDIRPGHGATPERYITDLLVGRYSAWQVSQHRDEDRTLRFVVRRGLSDILTAASLDDMRGKSHQKLVARVVKIRHDAKARAATATAKLPTHEELITESEVAANRLTIRGRHIDGLLNVIANHETAAARTRLTTHVIGRNGLLYFMAAQLLSNSADPAECDSPPPPDNMTGDPPVSPAH